MGGLAVGLAFPLGGGITPPYIVNLAPAPRDEEAGVTEYVRLTIRDVESYIQSNFIQVAVGYASVFADGGEDFREDLPRTFLSSILPDPVAEVKATIESVSEGMRLTKTLASAEQSVYFTKIDGGSGYRSALAAAVIRPDLISVGATGAVMGLELGQRNTGAYVFLDYPGGIEKVRLAGPADEAGVRVPDVSVTFNWTNDIYRYVLIWNEASGEVEVYAISSTNVTYVLMVESISSFQQYDSGLLGSSTPRRGGAGDITMVYGIEGPIGDQATFGNVMVTKDVGFPLIDGIRPGSFLTLRRTDELIRYSGGDPRDVQLSSWFGPDDLFLPNRDPDGVVQVLANLSRSVEIIKNTQGKTMALYREEPSFQGSNLNGIFMEAEFKATDVDIVDARITGMSFLIYDGQTAWVLSLLANTNVMALVTSGAGGVGSIANYASSAALDWNSYVRVRLIIDPRRGKVGLFSFDDFTTPILEMDFDRSDFPSGVDLGLSALPPFIAFGHPHELDTTGSFTLKRMSYSHYYQAYEAGDGHLPDAVETDPVWLLTASGFQDNSPLWNDLLGGGFGIMPLGYYIHGGLGPAGTSVIVDGQLEITTDPGDTQVYYRSGAFDGERGAVLEAKVQFTDWKPRTRTGSFMVIDDGLKAYMLSFVETDIGKFVGVPVDAGSGSFVEVVGTDGEAESLSFKIDWSEPHVYRMERRPLDGLYIFVDDAVDPELVILDSARVDFPTSQFGEPVVAFGQFSIEGSVSLWDHVRTMFGRGYEVSTRKVDPTETLEAEIAATQAIVVAFAEDLD